MTEDQLLSGVVVAFSQKHPKKRGQLFHPANERNHSLQAIQAKAKGIHKGVSDLIFFEALYYPRAEGFLMLGVELKVAGSRHDRTTVEAQVEWGETLELQGGVWRLCMSVEESLSCFELDYKGLTTQQVRQMLEQQKGTKIKF